MMGMGEPLANFDNVVPALRLLLDDNAYGLSRRRVTLSTSGLVPWIDRLRDECPVALAVSLHAPNDALRDRLVPINRKHPLATLMAACLRYLERAPRDFVTFEYVMLDGVNDQPEHAARADRARARRAVQAQPDPVQSVSRQRDSRRARASASAASAHALQDAGIVATIRKTRGDDIDAACGQLAGQVQRPHRSSGSRPAFRSPSRAERASPWNRRMKRLRIAPCSSRRARARRLRIEARDARRRRRRRPSSRR